MYIKIQKTIFWFLFPILIIPFLSIAEDRGNTTIQSFNKAKKILLKQIYADHQISFYCGCPFASDGQIIPSDRYTPKKINSRSNRIEWDHVVPAENFGRSFKEWREGGPECVDKKGKAFKSRNCARKTVLAFRYMEADLYNLVPAVGEINGRRSNFRFGMIPGEARDFGKCDFEVADRMSEPPPEVRGDIARIYFYMDWAYPGRGIIGGSSRNFFEVWSKSDPVDSWERKRSKRIERIQRNLNPFVK